MTERGLVHFDRARRELALVTDLDEIKAIRDKAEALRAYQKQIGAGLEMQNRCAEIKIRAERRAGELLAETVQHQGGTVTSCYRIPDGISKIQSHRWQSIARLPEPMFEREIGKAQRDSHELTSAGMLRLAKRLQKEERRQAKIEAKAAIPDELDERYELLCGDIAEVGWWIEAESVDIIVTDPPYGREHLALYETLARLGSYALKPGGSMLVMTGQSYLPEVLALMIPQIRYHWALAYLTPGGQSVQLWQRKVNTFWKPVLWFVKGDYKGDWVGDVTRSAVNANDKRFHDWGQSESGMEDLLERFTYPGDLVLDPFCGGGTTGVVAVAMHRRFVGIDIDQGALEITRTRLMEIPHG